MKVPAADASTIFFASSYTRSAVHPSGQSSSVTASLLPIASSFALLPMLSVMSTFMGVTSGLSQASGSWQIDDPCTGSSAARS